MEIDISPFILPFSYVKTPHHIIGKEYLYNLLTPLQIQQIETLISHTFFKYRPVWGLKLDTKCNIIDIELYFYQYDPCTRKILYAWDSIDKLITMYSMDVLSNGPLNLYYVSYSTDLEDKGYSTQNSILQNYYYRYNSNHILKYTEYIHTEYLTYYKNIKTTFIADKLKRNMIGVYYDGISSIQFSSFLNQEKLHIPSIPEDMYASIHIDYDKTDSNNIRYGIYGILY